MTHNQPETLDTQAIRERIAGRKEAESLIHDLLQMSPQYCESFYEAMKLEIAKRLLETKMCEEQIVIVSTVGSHAKVELFGTTIMVYKKHEPEVNQDLAIVARDRLHARLRDWAFNLHMQITQQ